MKQFDKKFVNKNNIDKCLQVNYVDFETQVWACIKHMLKVKIIPFISEINVNCKLCTL